MNGLRSALMWLTVLPLRPQSDEDFSLADASRWFPLVGLIIGVAVFAAMQLGMLVDSWLAALLGVITWLGITGFLHADGLADLADGLGAAHGDRSRLIEVMKGSTIGAFGVLVLILLVVSKLVLLKLLADKGAMVAVILIPVWTRLAVLWWANMLEPLTEGSGAALHELELPSSFWMAGGVLLAVSFLATDGLWLAPLALYGWYLFLEAKLQGMNGDALGAGIEVSEVLMLLLTLILI